MAQVAVLGGGMLGACLALELARLGASVVLYDQEEACLTQAGVRNEGKLHLGFVYGGDRSFRTAELMMEGALSFYPLMRRWLGPEVERVALSSPFVYAVEEGSLLSVEACEAHFAALERALSARGIEAYPGEWTPVERWSDGAVEGVFGEKIVAAFRTPERSIDVREMGRLIRERVAREERIEFRGGCTVAAVALRGDGVELEWRTGGERRRSHYPVVANALWAGRMEIDQQVGIFDEKPWSYRLKYAIFLEGADRPHIPSVTFIQGAYGDVVNFGEGNYYVSWYPLCMQQFWKNEQVAAGWRGELTGEEAEALAEGAIGALANYLPAVGELGGVERARALAVPGGIIYAQGGSDVTDPDSGLHKRYEPQIQVKGGYYSINPGKYTLCPYFAAEAAREMGAALGLSPETGAINQGVEALLSSP